MSGADPRFAQAVEFTTATYDRAATDYAERHEDLSPFWAEQMERFLALLEDAEAERPIPPLGRPGDDISLEDYLNFIPVLDAGCGPGRDARAFAAHGLPVVAVDLSQGMLDAAGERTARRLPKGAIRYAVMDLRRLDLPDASCRGVWCAAALLHLPRRSASRAVAELARVARPGAPITIILKDRQPDADAERYEPYPSGEAAGARRFYSYYTPDEASALVTGAGLTLLDLIHADERDGAGEHQWLCAVARRP